MIDVCRHYDLLVENGNDPVLDDAKLEEYMNKWDGEVFLANLGLNKAKSILEIGCGTGRMLKKIEGQFGCYVGIDLSSKTIEKAKEHFNLSNVQFICDDFLIYKFDCRFNTIFSTLTFMHIKEKRIAIDKVYALLKEGGNFVLSIDKNQQNCIDTGYSQIKVYPDDCEEINYLLKKSGFKDIKITQTEFAHIFSAIK